ncbi:MAG: protein kinase [Planctomycetota bacterium]
MYPVLDRRRIRSETYWVIEKYGGRSRPKERVLHDLGANNFQERVIHELENDGGIHRRLQNLARLTGTHLPFARILTTARINEKLLVVTEHVPGKSLNWYQRTNKRISHFQAIRLHHQLVWQICNLNKLTGILHGDISPNNLIVSPNGTRLMLIDFGSSFSQSDRMSADDGEGHKDLYAAPEILLGERPSISSEQFSVASVFYEMLTDKLPFTLADKKSFRELDTKIPPPSVAYLEKSSMPDSIWQAVDKFLKTSLSLNPDCRFSTQKEWLEHSDNLLRIANNPETNVGKSKTLSEKIFGIFR